MRNQQPILGSRFRIPHSAFRNRGGFAALLGLLAGLSPAVAAERPANIQRAIDRGVAFLKANQSTEDGMWHYGTGETSLGATALAGLTLVECGVPLSDPAVTKAADVVRQQCLTSGYTYSLSLAIMFLDRLEEEADVILIQSMAVRLLAGQTAAGGWTYHCPGNQGEGLRQLTDQLKRQNELRAAKEIPKKKNPDDVAKRGLPIEIRNQLQRIQPPQAPIVQPGAGGGRLPTDTLLAISNAEGDNSNTQFAALGLWVARRNGMPVEEALARVERRFRNAQHADGGWTYVNTNLPIPLDWSYPAAMTCSGLIGLAVGQGIAKDNKDLNKDPNIKAGFTNLANHLQSLANVSVLTEDTKGYYFLWSMERVAEVYGLKMIGKTDWYRWASQVIVNSQKADGGFYGLYARGGVDTCFALLVLARANVAKDLSHNLRGRLKDGIVTLRSGGVGREALENLGKKSEETRPDKGKAPNLTDPTGQVGSRSAPSEEADVESRAARMSNELAKADPSQQTELLEKFQEGRGSAYTLALAGAIPRLNGEAKSKARDALANRFTRMTAATLRQELKDDDPEIRRAASLACAMKDDKAHIPDLIPMLQDPEPIVGRAAHAALKSLSGKDFGPKTGASAQDLANSVASWKGWWDKFQADKEQGK